MEVRKGEPIKDGSEIIGARTKVKVVKNKVAPPFKTCEFDIIYGKGISRSGEVLDMAIELDIINKNGSWFSYNGTKLGQGKENVKEILLGNAEMMKEIEEKITTRIKELAQEESKKAKEQKEKNSKKSEEKDRLEDAAEKAAEKAAEAESDDSFADDDFMPISGDPDIDNDDSFDEFTPV